MRIVFLCLLGFSLLYSNDKICEEYKIAIDIGHTLKKGGATSSKGINEYHFNKRVSYELMNALKKKGFKKAFLINPNDVNISLKGRVQKANKKKANLFISIHHDSVQEHYLKYKIENGKKYHYSYNFSGHSIFYSKRNKKYKESLKYANLLGDELVKRSLVPTHHHAEKIKGENRKLLDKEKGIYEFDMLYVLRNTNMPAVLLELGIIVNPKDEEKLNQEAYRKLFIDSIINSISKYSDLNSCK